MNLKVGVLAIQGGFSEHEYALLRCLKQNGGVLDNLNLEISRVTQAEDVKGLDGLIIPGGESSVSSLIMDDAILDELNIWANDDKHVVFGTCAGLIALSKNIENSMEGQQSRFSKLARINVTTSRNFFGRQLNSFEGQVAINEKAVSKFAKNKPQDIFNGVFIRAPGIVAINGLAVKTLATLHIEGTDVIVGVEEKNCIALAFHPELTEDIRWHAYFLNMIMERK
ncbi:uncharacterized protein LOC114523842 [Dendronephthya gigantea]|uniref:uncharacterized protein LOC114523842 n=1 Tax=Dendronephthya gigantea TaxID=151771 RepID=UPI00106C3C49|nr:uncharacterized protein LOC114523842 [Dendronephthya gigantea]